MKKADYIINGSALLAPMAGVTDRAFREICIEYGASFVTTEMVSAKGIVIGDRKSRLLMQLTPGEMPASVQIFGCEPEIMARAAREAEKTGCDSIDINMGCPAPKVAGHGGGAALMKDIKLAAETARACVNAVDIPVTSKIRSGWDNDSVNAVELSKRLEDAGVSALTVHGRTRKQMYAPPVNYEIIKEVKSAVSIPVIGNGDVTDALNAKHMFDTTGCDAVMVGRGALGAPWVFREINEFIGTGVIIPGPDIEERMSVMLRHITRLCEYKGDYVGIREARKHAGWYIKGVRGAASFRREIGALESIDELKALAEKVIESVKNEAQGKDLSLPFNEK